MIALQRISARLLLLLALAREPMPVDRLIETMWPNVGVDGGRNRLSVHLYRLEGFAGG